MQSKSTIIVPFQCSKLTFSKSHLLVTFNGKMVAIKKFTRQKKPEEEDSS